MSKFGFLLFICQAYFPLMSFRGTACAHHNFHMFKNILVIFVDKVLEAFWVQE